MAIASDIRRIQSQSCGFRIVIWKFCSCTSCPVPSVNSLYEAQPLCSAKKKGTTWANYFIWIIYCGCILFIFMRPFCFVFTPFSTKQPVLNLESILTPSCRSHLQIDWWFDYLIDCTFSTSSFIAILLLASFDQEFYVADSIRKSKRNLITTNASGRR